ncbi:MAG: S41 family peptidase [Chthoniobacterales bacterium]
MPRPRNFLTSVFLPALATAAFAQPPTAKPASTVTPSPSPTVMATPTPPAKSIVDAMTAAELEQAIQLLKSNYINPDAVSETEMSRATLEGLLMRLGRGVVLLPESAAPAGEPPVQFYGEILENHVGYLRVGSLTRENLEAMDAALQSYAAKKVDAAVLDLRASDGSNDFSTAAEFAKRFCAKGKPLFTLRKIAARQEKNFTSDREPAYQGLLILLTDADTTGAAEAIAGTIRLNNKSVVIGQPTGGRAVEYSDLKLASGKALRVAVGEVILPENRPLFPGGLKPDVPVEMGLAEKREVFQQSREKGMSGFIYDVERPHLNEAALLSGKNPEIEAMETAQRRGRAVEKATVRDPVVQRALDLVTSIGVYQRR